MTTCQPGCNSSKLLRCQDIFHDARDDEMLGKTLTALGEVESTGGNGDDAILYEHDALRCKCRTLDTIGIADSFWNLGGYHSARARNRPSEDRTAGDQTAAFASHLAAALIGDLADHDDAGEPIRSAAGNLREFSDSILVPANIKDLGRGIGRDLDKELDALISWLSPNRQAADKRLTALVTRARELANLRS